MPITFEDVSANIDAPPPAATPQSAQAAAPADDELAQRIEQALQLRAERLARLSTD